jgi:flavodoxin I
VRLRWFFLLSLLAFQPSVQETYKLHIFLITLISEKSQLTIDIGGQCFYAKILILYYSQTGNTQKMARAVAEGARTVQGVDVEVKYYATPEELAGFDAVVVGIPTYHHDMTVDIKKLFEEAAVKNINLNGKIGAAFGSYGWSGEAPRLILEIMKNRFGMDTIESPILVKYSPSESELESANSLEGRLPKDLWLEFEMCL